MLKGHIIGFACASLLLSILDTAAADDDNTAVGTIQEMGWGKFKIKDEDGTVRLFHISKKATSFAPADWRPMMGDKVSIKFSTFQRRSATITQVDTVTLVKAGPNTPRITSPVDVEIREVGRSGFKVKIVESGKLVKFSRHRATQMDPVGWVPSVGDKARITFSFRSGLTYSITYLADKVEKVKEQK